MGVHALGASVAPAGQPSSSATATRSCSGPAGIGETGRGAFGIGVSLSGVGDTALIGAWSDRKYHGRGVGVHTVGVRVDSARRQARRRLHPLVLRPKRLRRDRRWRVWRQAWRCQDHGDTALVSAPGDNHSTGAAWVADATSTKQQVHGLPHPYLPDGSIRLAVTLPGPGSVDVLETAWNDNLASIAELPQPAARRFAFARANTTARHAGTFALSVTPNARGRLPRSSPHLPRHAPPLGHLPPARGSSTPLSAFTDSTSQ